MINPKKIIESSKGGPLAENRHVDETYAEVVIVEKDLLHWNRHLESFLGPAIKPAGRKPTRDENTLAQEYGGIRLDQTLFRKQVEGVIITAVMWPWQGGGKITLKIFATGS
jgi:hypothetical protein